MYDLTELRMSYSSGNTLESCARKYEFSKFYQHADYQESLPGEVGHCLHEGYQHYMIHRDREAAIAAMMMRYPIHLNTNPNDFRSIEACYAVINKMIDSGLFLTYEIAKIKCLDGEIRSAVEVPFEINIIDYQLPLPDERKIPVRYVGFIDMILLDKMNDEFVVVDIKTTRDYLKDYAPKYMFDDQCLPYSLVLERILGHEIDNIKHEYMIAYVDIMKPFTRKLEFRKSKADVRDWARGLYVQLKQLELYASTGWFPRRGTNCISYKRVCGYMDMCASRDYEGLQKQILMGNPPAVKEFPEPWISVDLELAA